MINVIIINKTLPCGGQECCLICVQHWEGGNVTYFQLPSKLFGLIACTQYALNLLEGPDLPVSWRVD